MIKIVSGFSDKGGSTSAFIDLTNEFNKRGVETTFYGPHSWHLDKCQSGLLTDGFVVNPDDTLICHFLRLPSRPPAKKVVLHCHEKWWFKVAEVKQYWDTVVFLHEEHRMYHNGYTGPSTLIPNLKPNLIANNKTGLDLVAGIIGSIEDRKQTHLSIQRALADGCEQIYLFGHISDQNYYEKYVEPLLSDNIRIVGFMTDKQKMYDSIGRVYHSSKGEVACLVKDECWLTNTQFFGNEETNNIVSSLSNDEIFELWKKTLNL
jgi:hypothetical protein